MTRAEAARRAEQLRAVGARLFGDRTLSASGTLACASCHRPDRAFGPPDGLAVRLGGAANTASGVRAVPSLRYLQGVPAFTEHYYAPPDDGDESIDNGPAGGLTWDGRVDRGRDQARLPLLSPLEMANASEAAVSRSLLAAPYAADLGTLAAGGRETVFQTALEALEAYEETPELFAPYSSRFDAVLNGRATLTPLEARGREVFEDPARGNCASCHPSEPDRRGVPPVFSDFGYAAIGLPRNHEIPANANPRYFDLGLCGPFRSTLSERPDTCGKFRTPSLRNVATRGVFFHNGVVHSLRDAVAFYATRDTQPERWYPLGSDGAPVWFDDLPPADRANVERGAPFGRRPGSRSSLSEADIDAVVAFLGTLTDADAGSAARPAAAGRSR